MKYNKQFQTILTRFEKIEDKKYEDLKEEILILSALYEKKDARLNKIIKLSDKQQRAILDLNEKLDDYKHNLEQKVEEEIEKRREQEKLLLEQTRIAALSEMINAVAHQWMQPINIVWMDTDLLALDAKKNNGLSAQRVTEFKNKSFKQITHLIETLRNFRDFFQPIKDKQTFKILPIIQSVLLLMQDELSRYSINVKLQESEDFILVGNENEFKHIFINLFNNSKYAFLEKNIMPRKITISIIADQKKIEYIDNAGGIDEEILPNIFKMHTTSKAQNGTGLGLYMSQQIAHKHQGELLAQNIPNGAKFTFIYKGKQ